MTLGRREGVGPLKKLALQVEPGKVGKVPPNRRRPVPKRDVRSRCIADRKPSTADLPNRRFHVNPLKAVRNYTRRFGQCSSACKPGKRLRAADLPTRFAL